jgi:hypothetical protein
MDIDNQTSWHTNLQGFLLLFQARSGIEKFCEHFEKKMLEEFDRGYREADSRVMAVSHLKLYANPYSRIHTVYFIF